MHCAVAAAQPPKGRATARAYSLRHGPVEQVADQLRTVLASQRGESSVVVDRRSGTLIVEGNEAAHRLAVQLIERIDRPADARQAAASSDKPAVASYPVPASGTSQALASLREAFGPSTGAKFAVNQRNGHILALAPPELQQQIAQHVRRMREQFMKHNASQREGDRRQPTARQDYRLRHVGPDDVLMGLMNIWGRQLPVDASEDGTVETLTIPTSRGSNVTLEIDRSEKAVQLVGPGRAVDAWRRVVAAIDSPQDDPDENTVIMPLRWAQRDKVEIALAGFRAARRQPWAGDLVSMIFQPEAAQAQQPPPVAPGPDAPGPDRDAEEDGRPVPPPIPGEADGEVGERGVIGPVQIEFLEGLDVIVIRGNKRDVERVTRIIEDIERLSAQTQPVVEVYRLNHANNEAVVAIVLEIYNEHFAPRHGGVTMTPLVKPNAVLLVGRAEAVAAAKELIAKVDEPVSPEAQFQVFPLKHMPVEQAETTLTEFYEERGGLGTRVRISADFRSNSLIVEGSPRDLEEVAAMLERLDISEIEAVNQLRVFHLQNSFAEDLAPVIQQAIRGDLEGRGVAGGPQAAGGATREQQIRSTMLTLSTIDSAGGRLLRSGVLTDVQVQADVRSNALVVRGPSEAMELIGALIEQLDRLPSEAQIKVFTIVNGDAASLATTLDELFGVQQQTQAQPGVGLGAGQGESSLVPLRFSVDARTNSILASGSAADLRVVEALLLRLDEGDIRERITVVYRLKNSPALDVAAAINEFLGSERQVQQLAQGDATPFEQIEREVVVVPEPVSNSLIVSAAPRYFEEVEEIVQELDERPPMVLIQVLIAEVDLNDTDEIGVELGIQDSLLFDRSAVVDGLLDPGFNFNNRDLGNSSDAASLATRENLAGQALSTFALGRMNSELGYGGLVLSAGSESLSVLIRALQDERSLQILSRPQVMTLDNQPAFIQVGERVPRITSSNIVNNAVINNTTLENVGILLGVTPRIAPDGQVVMEIDAEKSEVGPEADGIPISINENGDVIRSPRIEIITAQTTVSARSGQTVILGGLITRRTSTVTRRVPYLSDVPVLGNLFRFDSVQENRGELLFIMTPYIVRGEEDIEMLKHMESSRMSWCLADVVNVHGQHGLTGAFESPHGVGGCQTIYPDEMPFAPAEQTYGEPLPQPEFNAPQQEQLPLPAPETGRPPQSVPEQPPTPQPETGRQEFGRRREAREVRPAEYLRPSQAPRRFAPAPRSFAEPRQGAPRRLPQPQ